MQNVIPILRSTRSNQQQLLFTFWMSLLIQWTSGQGSTDGVMASVGETVILTAPASKNAFKPLHWYRGSVLTPSNRIFSYFIPTSSQTNGEANTGRELGLSDGSLQIRPVQLRDTGNYTVTVGLLFHGFKINQKVFATRELKVYDRNALQETAKAPWKTDPDASGPRNIWLPLCIGFSVAAVAAAAIIVAVVLHCKARRRQPGIQKDKTTYENTASINHLERQHVNRNAQLAPSAAPPKGAESLYTELKHGDRAVYDQIKRV